MALVSKPSAAGLLPQTQAVLFAEVSQHLRRVAARYPF